LDSEDVVVRREHVESVQSSISRFNRNLRVVDSGEVAGTRWLVFFWLKREGVRIDTWHWGTGVVVEWLDGVEVNTLLFLKSVLTVEDQLEGIERTRFRFVKYSGTINSYEWRTKHGWCDITVGNSQGGQVTTARHSARRKVPQVSSQIRTRTTFINAPDQFLNWVVVGQSDLLISGTNSVGTSVLDLFDQVFVTLLRKSSALFSVKVDVVTPHLQGGKVVTKVGSQVKVQSDFVVLQGNQWQGQSWVSVEEEDEWQEDRRVSGLDTSARSHLTVVRLLGFVHVQFRVQSPPLLVVLVDSLATNGQFNVLNGTFRGPGIKACNINSGTSRQFNVHVRDQITVSGDRDGNATVARGSTVDSLFDVFHREVSVAFVNRLEESDFWVTSQVDILGAVGDELHETTGHIVCFCTIGRDFFFG